MEGWTCKRLLNWLHYLLSLQDSTIPQHEDIIIGIIPHTIRRMPVANNCCIWELTYLLTARSVVSDPNARLTNHECLKPPRLLGSYTSSARSINAQRMHEATRQRILKQIIDIRTSKGDDAIMQLMRNTNVLSDFIGKTFILSRTSLLIVAPNVHNSAKQ